MIRQLELPSRGHLQKFDRIVENEMAKQLLSASDNSS